METYWWSGIDQFSEVFRIKQKKLSMIDAPMVGHRSIQHGVWSSKRINRWLMGGKVDHDIIIHVSCHITQVVTSG
jgi:hypothetical protein